MQQVRFAALGCQTLQVTNIYALIRTQILRRAAGRAEAVQRWRVRKKLQAVHLATLLFTTL
jgi:hypothetical protein